MARSHIHDARANATIVLDGTRMILFYSFEHRPCNPHKSSDKKKMAEILLGFTQFEATRAPVPTEFVKDKNNDKNNAQKDR